MNSTSFSGLVVAALMISPWFSVTQAAETVIYSPYVGQDFPKNVYFGDTHLHTSLSFDAYGDGNTTKGRRMPIDSQKESS